MSKADAELVLHKYPAYTNWDADSQLKRSILRWRQELGLKQLVKTLRPSPAMLIHPSSKLLDHGAYFSSVGVKDPRKLIIARPEILKYSSSTLQAKVAALVSAGLPQEHVGALIERHPDLVTVSAGKVSAVLKLVEAVTGLAITSSAGLLFVLRGHRRMFAYNVAVHEESLAYLSGLGVSKAGKMKAFTSGVTCLSAAVLHERSSYLMNRFGWSQEDLHSKVSSAPSILQITSSRVETNLQNLQSLGFSQQAVIRMGTRQPTLLNANWTTKLRKDKWHFIANVMCMQHSDIDARFLESSLANKLVPRWDFLCLRAKQYTAMSSAQPPQLVMRHTYHSDSKFAEVFNVFDEKHGNMVYDECFREASWNRYRQLM